MMSMTGFGRGTFSLGTGHYRLELRSVNSRYLDMKMRLPWNDGEVEKNASDVLRKRLSRGRVELMVVEQGEQRSAMGFVLDDAIAAQLKTALRSK